jgi:hypothetical protein
VSLDPIALAQLPYVAFLLVVGGGIFTLLATGRLRWDRELKKAEAETVEVRVDRDYWKALALKGAETNAKYADHVEQLTSVVEALAPRRGKP